MRPAEELLYDSEATFRLVDHAIQELSASEAELDHEPDGSFENAMAQPVGFAHILDGLSRAAALVARLDEAGSLPDAERHLIAGTLRDELSAVRSHFQFHAVSAQTLEQIES